MCLLCSACVFNCVNRLVLGLCTSNSLLQKSQAWYGFLRFSILVLFVIDIKSDHCCTTAVHKFIKVHKRQLMFGWHVVFVQNALWQKPGRHLVFHNFSCHHICTSSQPEHSWHWNRNAVTIKMSWNIEVQCCILSLTPQNKPCYTKKRASERRSDWRDHKELYLSKKMNHTDLLDDDFSSKYWRHLPPIAGTHLSRLLFWTFQVTFYISHWKIFTCFLACCIFHLQSWTSLLKKRSVKSWQCVWRITTTPLWFGQLGKYFQTQSAWCAVSAWPNNRSQTS